MGSGNIDVTGTRLIEKLLKNKYYGKEVSISIDFNRVFFDFVNNFLGSSAILNPHKKIPLLRLFFRVEKNE